MRPTKMPFNSALRESWCFSALVNRCEGLPSAGATGTKEESNKTGHVMAGAPQCWKIAGKSISTLKTPLPDQIDLI